MKQLNRWSQAPLIKAKQAIFAGDHKQLPPTILSNDERLKVSMFERFSKIYKNALHTLEIQYRMNEKINNFSSCEFYECRVKTFEKIKNITIKDLNIKEDEFYGCIYRYKLKIFRILKKRFPFKI